MAKVAQKVVAAPVDPWADVDAIDAQIKAEREVEQAKWLAIQVARLAAHPEEIACSIPGCTGTVRPEYQRKSADGKRTVGFCPRDKAHAFLRKQR